MQIPVIRIGEAHETYQSDIPKKALVQKTDCASSYETVVTSAFLPEQSAVPRLSNYKKDARNSFQRQPTNTGMARKVRILSITWFMQDD